MSAMMRSLNRRALRKIYESLNYRTTPVTPRSVISENIQSHPIAFNYISSASYCTARTRYSETYPPLLYPLPDLKLPPPLPEFTEKFPTQITTLENGVRIASENAFGPAACVGMFVNSGSIYETKESSGVSHILERLAFKDTKNRTHLQIVQAVEERGGNINAATSRDQTGYTYDTLKNHLPQAVELLIDCIKNPAFLQTQIDNQLALIKEEIENVKKEPEKFLLETLHSVGYSGGLGNPLLAPSDVCERISRDVIEKFYHENYTADRIVLSASGVAHEDLLKIAAPLLSDMEKSTPMKAPESTYVGGEFKFEADEEKTAVALAFEVPGGWQDLRTSTAITVLQHLMGGGGSFSSGGPGKGMHSRLYLRVLTNYREAQSFTAFNTLYNDSGLFGICMITEPKFVKKLVGVACNELLTVATPGQVTELELLRAKNATKSAILMNLESRAVVCEDIGRQILTYGCRHPVAEFMKMVDELTLSDIASLMERMLSSPLTMGSWGNVSEVPSYATVSRKLQV